MAGAGKAGLGIGTAALGGAASGAAFGPIGAGIGAGVGGLLGLWGALDQTDEEELRRQRDQAKKMAAVQVLRNRAAQLGAPTSRLDMELQLQNINDRYNQGMDQLSDVGPQDFMNLAQNAAAIGGKVKDWTGVAKGPPQGELMRNSDLYGAPDSHTGLARDDDGIMTDPMLRRRRT